jgi:hypothetical protein
VYLSASAPNEYARGFVLTDGTVRGDGPAVGTVLPTSGYLSSVDDHLMKTYL